MKSKILDFSSKNTYLGNKYVNKLHRKFKQNEKTKSMDEATKVHPTVECKMNETINTLKIKNSLLR